MKDLLKKLAEAGKQDALRSLEALTAAAKELGYSEQEIQKAVEEAGSFPLDDEVMEDAAGGITLVNGSSPLYTCIPNVPLPRLSSCIPNDPLPQLDTGIPNDPLPRLDTGIPKAPLSQEDPDTHLVRRGSLDRRVGNPYGENKHG